MSVSGKDAGASSRSSGLTEGVSGYRSRAVSRCLVLAVVACCVSCGWLAGVGGV